MPQTMEQKHTSRRSSKLREEVKNPSSSTKGYYRGRGSTPDREKVVQEAVASVIVNERTKYETKIVEAQSRLTKSQMEADRLLDEVSNLRLQIREMKNDRIELVRAHQESMSLLAQVSEEKLVEIKSRSEQEAIESKAAQEEALRTVLEMMERDCAERVAELDNELSRVEEEKERATRLQLEAMAKAAAEEQDKTEIEEAAKLALQKLIEERAARDEELQILAEREKELKKELEMTKQRAEMDMRAATASHSLDSTSSVDGSAKSSIQPVDVDMRDSERRRPPVINRRSLHKHSDSPFLSDPLNEMTLGRRIALHLQQFSWYQPRGRHWDVEGLGLQSAWAYFEHSILPRYIVGKFDWNTHEPPKLPRNEKSKRRNGVSVYKRDLSTDAGDDAVSTGEESDIDDWLYTAKPKMPHTSTGDDGRDFWQKGDFDRAEPGECTMPTKLYSPFFTPLSQLGDFGIGIGLYFSYLRAVAFIALIAGCINLPNILYYASDEYSKCQPGVQFLLKGSAICTEQVWVPCPRCSVDEFAFSRSRIAGTTTVTSDGELQTLVFALKNACDGATVQVGIINMASLGFILLAMVALSLYQRRKQIAFDEQEQTAQDYSIEISNPPADATEPEEWKEFFESRFAGHLTCCTVTIDNDLLIKTLAERREVLFEIEDRLKDSSILDTLTLSELAVKVEHSRLCPMLKSRLSSGMPELVGRLSLLNTQIQGLAQQEYRATRVFCTFETEGAQRQVLSKMTVGYLAALRNNTYKINSNLLFRGEHVLHVREPEEPSCIRWTDLDDNWITWLSKLSVSTLISLACIASVAVIVYFLRLKSALYAALAISISNAFFPLIAKVATSFESHTSMTGMQTSLLIKITAFRWVVTAVIITIITPFTSTITNGPEHLIQSIYTIFLADLVTSNVLQLADIPSNFNRHFLAPRARSQERMNLLMSGTDYSIAERYTNLSKTLFLTFYYCAIYPSAFFLCALTLFVNFFVDKFCLLRMWKPSPMLGASIASFSRIYLMSTAIGIMAVVSSYFYSGFPFDNLCAENVSHSAYYGTWKITDGEGQDSTALIEPGVRSYHFCDQFLAPSFPALPEAQPSGSTWMTAEQEQLTIIFGWVSVGVVGLIGMVFLFRMLLSIKTLFNTSHRTIGNIHGHSFSEVKAISSYIPQIHSNLFTHPLLAVNIDGVDECIFDWSDPDRSHSYYDLTRDAEQLLKGNEDVCHRSFSQIRHWPPNEDFVEEDRSTKSALRKKSKRDINSKRNNVSWSSKVTCKTYSKDDPNNSDSFNANVSTSEGLNFKSHFDPLYDPHAQNEARVHKKRPPNANPSTNPSMYTDVQNIRHTGQPQHIQQPPNQHFDQYWGVGLDHANQPPDSMYGDSQNQNVSLNDSASWDGSDGSGGSQDNPYESTGSFHKSPSSGSGISTTYSADSPYESDGSFLESGSSAGDSFNTHSQEENYEDFSHEDDEIWSEEQGNASFSTGSSTSTSGRLPSLS
ncbi:hypothetical protein ACHAXA_002054 [Cyclostephanos tholiformis]|uniref:Uncharacterized protein n=1 Tax=Cyclostephanos tholiformis TaxID=382380 RepID=A0ABD3STM1_9STRA